MVKGDGELPKGMLDMGQYSMADDETLTGPLKQYAAAARTTEQAVADLRDMDRRVPCPALRGLRRRRSTGRRAGSCCT